MAEIETLRQQVGRAELHPKRVKQDLGRRVVGDFHSLEAAAAAEQEFERRFSGKALPSKLVEKVLKIQADGTRLSAVIVEVGFAESNSSATRLMEQGSVRVDGERVSDRSRRVDPRAQPFVLQVGKRKVIRVLPMESSSS